MDDNITVNDIPLKSYLSKSNTQKEVDREVRDIVSEEMTDRARSINKHFKAKYLPAQEKNSDVHIYTDDQIRKEFGLMAKPLRTRSESILYTLQNRGPSTVQELCDALPHVKINSLSAAVSMLHNRAVIEGSGIITRHKEERGFIYTLKEGIDHQTAYTALYNTRISREYNDKYKPAKGKHLYAEHAKTMASTNYQNGEEKVLHVMQLFGPISATDIESYFEGVKRSTVSARISTLYKKSLIHGGGLVSRKKRKLGGYFYNLKPGFSYDQVFNEIGGIQVRKQKPMEKVAQTNPQPDIESLEKMTAKIPDIPSKEKPNRNIDPLTVLPDMVTKAVEKAVANATKAPIVEQEQESDATINSKLTIEVNVQVNFNWGF